MKKLLAPLFVLTIAATAAAQTGRTMFLAAPAALGQTAQFGMTHPVGAAGNIYAILWSAPFAGTATVTVPGFTVFGDARIDQTNFLAPFTGVLNASGSVTHSLAVPNDPFFLGYAFDLQSIDLDSNTNSLYLADNDLAIVITLGLGTIEIATASNITSSTLLGNNDLQSITDSTIGAPVSHGNAPFGYMVIRYRGNEGFVEGYAGAFSATPHNSDIDSISNRRVAKRSPNGSYQVITCPNGYDVAIIRDLANAKQYSLTSYRRSTGVTTVIPGSTWIDTGTAAIPTQQNFYVAISRDGQMGAVYVKDSNLTTGFVPMVWAFRTDGTSPVVDITPAGTTLATPFFDGTLGFTNDFLLASGANGPFWTSATAPSTLLPLTLPNTTATNAPNVWAFPLSARTSPDGSTAYFPISSNPLASRGEMDMARLTNVAGSPVVTNYTQFVLPTGMAEFGYSAISPSNLSSSSNGIKCSVSPDGTKIAFLAATTVTSAFPGLCVADGTANPTLRTVLGATFYSEVAFINNTTVIFFAGTAITATNHVQSMYSLDVPSGVITQIGTATDIRTRGQFWSENKNWWYFIRSNTASTLNDIIAVNCATGTPTSVTGTEFGTPGPVGTIRTGSFNVTADPWFALEMQLRRAPAGANGNLAYFAARKETGTAAVFEDANLFRFDIENGGQAVQLTNNTGTGTTSTIRHFESLMISADGNHVAYSQRIGGSSTATEDAYHYDTVANTLTQVSVSNPTGQTITDGSILFVGNPARGLTWALGTGSAGTSLSVMTTNAKVEYVVLGSNTPILISQPPAGVRLYQVIGTHD